MTALQSARRSLLFVPGDSQRKIEKAAALPADTVILDLEDAVAPLQKQEARHTVTRALANIDFGRKERLIRINPPGTPLFQEDLDVTISARPDGYVLPKVETAGQLQLMEPILAAAEQENSWPTASMRLLALVETARGIMNINAIAQATTRLDALLFGAEDLAADIGAIRTPGGWELFYARSAVITAAAAYKLQAIDMVYVDFHDLEGLEKECNVARQLGYSGKMAIHPHQLEPINRLFSPSPEAIEQALRLVQAYHEQAVAGVGAFSLDGRMVDKPVIQSAHKTLHRARLAGLLPDT
jgi:citrate lyase beta subunit